jgi:hypothetical protein
MLNLLMRGLRVIANLPRSGCQWSDLQHSHSFSAGSFANVEIKGSLENIRFSVELWIRHSLYELAVRAVANVKSAPPIRHNVEASDPFRRKKVSVTVRAAHRRGAQWRATWLKSRENKALMSP